MPYIFANEGGYSNLAADHGGATSFGITEATARASGYSGDMRELTKDQASEIYHRKYWRFTPLDDQRVATKLMDLSVNLGPGRATRLAQQALNQMDAGVEVDGIYGPLTESTINSVAPGQFLEHLIQVSIDHYSAVVHHDPTQAVFLKGWLRRAQRVPNE